MKERGEGKDAPEVDSKASTDEENIPEPPKKVKVMYIEPEQKKVSQPLEYNLQQQIKTLSDNMFDKFRQRIDSIFKIKNEKELLMNITAQLESLY